MSRSLHVGLLIAAVALPPQWQAQVLTPSRTRLDSLPRPAAAPLPAQSPANGERICVDCHGWTIPRGREPAYIIKDAAARVLAMVPPGDTSYQGSQHPVRLLEPEMIASIDVVRDSALVTVLGRGFENGLLIVTLTPAGSEAWRRATRPNPPVPYPPAEPSRAARLTSVAADKGAIDCARCARTLMKSFAAELGR